MPKKIWCLIIIAALIFSLSACGKEDTDTTTDNDSIISDSSNVESNIGTSSDSGAKPTENGSKNDSSSKDNSSISSEAEIICNSHNFVKSTVLREASLTKEGEILLRCTKCEEIDVETVPKKYFSSIVTENGVKKAKVKGLDGSIKTVPIVPEKVLFLGNSLLLGMYNKYGMCATDDKNDYYYHVTQAILKVNPSCQFSKAKLTNFEAIENYNNFINAVTSSPWDGKSGASIADMLTSDLDLVIVQGGDNVNSAAKKEAFVKTCGDFVSLIKTNCPNARIIWVFGWYNEANVEQPIIKTCEKWGIECLTLSQIHTLENEADENQSHINQYGNTAPVDKGWITHPGNAGMKAVADLIIEKIGI